ncbi:hypothetical protein ALO35_200078 [Pseudomonas amygdali pv. lachrymans]|uniref:Uncharacterized protein n=1 Tax=Pseudomonas amygdali pv. lachrymans TaxID=53707 RepID=A0A0P9TTH8_PSEAV|nr:hypothetical protein ALO35_200078 [Pseudomonas amygdali pv. lachrymans]
MARLVVAQQAKVLPLGDWQPADDFGQRGFQPSQAGGTFFYAVFQRRVQIVPEILQDPLGHGQAEGNADKVVFVRQGFTEPGDEHQVLALFSKALCGQRDGLIPVRGLQIGLPVTLGEVIGVCSTSFLDLIEQGGKAQVFAAAPVDGRRQIGKRKVVEKFRHSQL